MRNKAFKFSPFWFRILMNFYPPYFFGRVKIQYVSKDFQEIKVRIRASIFNKNLSGTMFGGTLFSAADPFYPLMYWQNFAHQYNQKVSVWLKSAEIQYKRPATGSIYLHFKITQEDILEAKKALDEVGKFNKLHEVLLLNEKQELCARVNLVSYVGLS